MRLAIVGLFVLGVSGIACGSKVSKSIQEKSTAVETTLPEDGVGYGNQKAPIVMVEFGSFLCPICHEYVLHGFPAIDSQFIKTGRIRYRYVDLTPPSVPFYGSALASCLIPTMGFVATKKWVFEHVSIMSDARSAVDSAAAFSQTDRSKLLNCMTTAPLATSTYAIRQKLERASAAKLHVDGTPTFVVGVMNGKTLVGLPIVGFQSVDTLKAAIERAERIVK